MFQNNIHRKKCILKSQLHIYPHKSYKNNKRLITPVLTSLWSNGTLSAFGMSVNNITTLDNWRQSLINIHLADDPTIPFLDMNVKKNENMSSENVHNCFILSSIKLEKELSVHQQEKELREDGMAIKCNNNQQ